MFTEHDLKMAFDDGYVEGHKNGFDAGLQVAQPKWISVEERLPKDGQRVVGIAKNGMTGIMDYKDDGTPFAARVFGRCFSEIIWWMPLPEPPEDEDEN